MKQKSGLTLIGLTGIAFIISKVHIVPVGFWDNLFLISLFLLIVSGFLYMIEKGTFDLVFKSFRVFYKKSSKLQDYVSEVEYKEPAAEKARLIRPVIAGTVLKYSGFFMFISLTISYLFYY